MRKKVVFITGAAGEVGQALIKNLVPIENRPIISLDLKPLPAGLDSMVTHIQGDIMDHALLKRLISEYEIEDIFHLAALLSTRSEFSPDIAHRINVGATMDLMQLMADQSEWRGDSVRFIFPSSIAVYGIPDMETKLRYEKVREWEMCYPRTMYGCNKLYCELLGAYYNENYRQLAAERPVKIDFRCLRFPGLISAETLPAGGTSDYGPEMLHAAARGEPYACFVEEDVRIPFMVMPDAIKALIGIDRAPRERMHHHIYNVTSFSISAAEFHQTILKYFPDAQISFKPDVKRQNIVDTWPADLDDTAARRDWGWHPDFDLGRAFEEYLVPMISKRYQKSLSDKTI